ncbi:MAG: UbiA-like polyprenyltransferase [Anaerolineae bacterium]|nr:putative 4-hydroxybenzoate polyprenyltransferase [Anaerolineae bacterium]MDW8098869.1 UbiA-like polyprenyltransferase [Anaerolineae bacterium]
MGRVRIFLEMIKFEHTIFALPFAYLGMVLAARGWPGWHTFLWVTVAMIAARTLAMSVNRVADRHLDARNPRTAQRALPQRLLTPRQVWGAAVVSSVIFLLAAWQLNDFVLRLAPLAMIALVGYSYTKRFTWLSHWVLGATDGAAVAGAWAAVQGSLADLTPWLLWGAVTVWIAGFDLIYACQDTEFDRAEGLHSVPARFGNATALRWAKANHVLTVLALTAVGWLEGLRWPYWAGVAATAGLLWWENSLVKPDDLSRVDLAFFNVNGYISVLVFLAAWIGLNR